jgi:uncharacterized repeat protein (TIGR02543 family)
VKKHLRLVALSWIALLLLTLFPLAIKPAKSNPVFTYERQWVDLTDPEFVAADSSGNFFVADIGNVRVQGFDDTGTFMWARNFFTTTGGVGVGGVAVSDLDIVWVTQPDIQATFAQTIGNVPLINMTTPSVFGAVATDNSGAIYVEDVSSLGVIRKYVEDDGVLGNLWSSEAYGSVVGIAVDDVFGRVYVVGSSQIRVLSSDTGAVLFSSWVPGFQLGGVAVDDAGNVYLTNQDSDTVSKFSSAGVLLGSFGGSGSGPGQFDNPSGVAVDGSGSVYVADTDNDRVQKFSQVEVPPLPPAPEGSYTYGGVNDDFAWSIVECSDGGFAIAGCTDSTIGDLSGSGDAWLVRTDSDGTELWNQTYGGIGWDRAYAVVECGDGGFALAGYTNSSGAGGWDFWLIKTDANGVEQWNQTYGGPFYEWAISAVECGDGGFALAGYKGYGAGIKDFWLVRTDSSGNELWNQTYGGAGDDWAWSVVETADGGFALTGYTNSSGAGDRDFWLVKTDAEGAMEWSQTYGGSGDDWGCSVIETSDDGFALAGYTASYGAGGPDFWLVKTDANGVEQWNQTYGGPEDDRAITVIETADGGFALIGPTRSFGAGDWDYWLIKTDSEGVEQWDQTFGGPDYEMTWSGLQTTDGRYAIAGSTKSFGAGNADFWLVLHTHKYTIDITVNPPEGGTVTKDPDMETYPLGTEVTLEATANEGYTFVGWSGDLSGTDNQQTLIIDEDPQVTATFSLDYIPPSEEPVTVYPHPNVTLTFDQVLTGGEVHVTTSYDGPPGYPLEGIGPYYYIEANPLTFTTVSVGIHYDDTGLTTEQEEALTLWRFDPAVPAVGDVNGNGRVDFIDLFLITLSLGTRPGQWRWNPACDINGDLRVNLVDLFIAILNFGKTSTPATWTNITDHVDIVNNVVYGETDHFSPYRVH